MFCINIMKEITKIFFAKIFHDINNLLCACSGYTEILIAEEDRPHQKLLLVNLNKCIIRLIAVVVTANKKLKEENL